LWPPPIGPWSHRFRRFAVVGRKNGRTAQACKVAPRLSPP
jgi:hypothetical protein